MPFTPAWHEFALQADGDLYQFTLICRPGNFIRKARLSIVYVQILRKFRSDATKENEDKERSPFMADLKYERPFSGTIGKWVGAVLTFIVLTAGWILNNTYINPIQVREIRGYVYEVDSSSPLPGATIFVVGQKDVQFEADENYQFSGKVKVRKKIRGRYYQLQPGRL